MQPGEVIERFRRTGALLEGHFILTSGLHSAQYLQCALVLQHPSEAEAFWKSFLRSLADRGLRGTKLVIADDHKGLRAAATKIFHATLQRCRIHWMRNALAHVPAKLCNSR